LSLALTVLFIGLPTMMNAQGPQPPGEKGDQELSDKTITQTEELVQALLQQGVPPECILGVDPQGIPIICETGGHDQPASSAAQLANKANLPAGTRGWETIPGIIRNDGVENFRLEVNVNGPVISVTLDAVTVVLVPPELAPVRLHDDGLGEDRVAGDFIYTVVRSDMRPRFLWPISIGMIRPVQPALMYRIWVR
jgi:hypothetical protein